MAESPSSKLGEFSQKKSNKTRGENPAAAKKKKHRRQRPVSSTKDWSFDDYETKLDGNRLTEVDGKQIPSNGRLSNREKEKPKSMMRRRLSFRKPKSLKMKKLNPAVDAAEPNEGAKPNELTGETEKEMTEMEDEKNIQSGRSEDEEEELFSMLTAEVVPQELVSEIHERAGILSPESCPDADTLTTMILNPEGHNGHEEPSGLDELVLNEKQAHAYAFFTSSQSKICLYVYDFSLGKLIGLWSFVVNRTCETTKQLLLYFISSLVKRYPHCFKVHMKKGKRRSKKAHKKAKVQTTEV